jgi:hypothetical protein
MLGSHEIDIGHGRISSDPSDRAWSDLIRSISSTVRSHPIRSISGHGQFSSDRYRASSDLIRFVGSNLVGSHPIDIGPGQIPTDRYRARLDLIRSIWGMVRSRVDRYGARSNLIQSTSRTVISDPMDMWHGRISSDQYRARSDLIRSDRYRSRPDLIRSISSAVGSHLIRQIGPGRISSDRYRARSDLIRSVEYGLVRSH